jgi:hypothetical protein
MPQLMLQHLVDGMFPVMTSPPLSTLQAKCHQGNIQFIAFSLFSNGRWSLIDIKCSRDVKPLGLHPLLLPISEGLKKDPEVAAFASPVGGVADVSVAERMG